MGVIALINGNINAQGSDIAKTGGFVETSGHYLSIDDNVIVKTKEWLLDPENVSIEAFSPSRADASLDSEFPIGDGDANNPKKSRNQNNTNQHSHFKFSEKCQGDEYNGIKKTYR